MNTVMTRQLEVLFIDANVQDRQLLTAGLKPGVQDFVLESNTNGVEQISAILANLYQSEAFAKAESISLHILAHGTPGCISLGNDELSLSTLDRDAESLKGWCQKISKISFYSCNLAAGDAGAEFLTKLHHITGVTIHASTTKVGNAELGGNWVLDRTYSCLQHLKPDTEFKKLLPSCVPFKLDACMAYPYVLMPSIEDDSSSGPEDQDQTINILDNDDVATYEAIELATQPTNGSATLNANNTVTYTPNTHFSGVDSFTYSLQTPDYTIAQDDRAIADPNIVTSINVLRNDIDAQGDALSVTLPDGNTSDNGGTLAIQPDGTINYTAAANFLGLDIFTYQIDDGNGNIDTATVQIDVRPADPRSQHYLPPRAAGSRHANNPMKLLITTENATAEGVISFPGSGQADIPFSITDTTSDFTLTLGEMNLGGTTTFNAIGNDGIKVITTNGEPVNVQLVQENSNGQSFLSSKGIDGLGTEFYAGEVADDQRAEGDAPASVIAVMATEDNTQITFEAPNSATWNWEGTTSQTQTVTLDAGETYIIQPENNVSSAITGAHITSDKPIAVSSGAFGVGLSGGAIDNGWDQLVPVNRVGKDYVVVRGPSGNEEIEVIATADNTEVYINGTLTTTLNRGDVYTQILTGSTGDAFSITTSEGAYLFQSSGNVANRGENGVSLIPAIAPSGRTRVRFRTPHDPGAINVITSADAVDSLTWVNVTTGETIDLTTQQDYVVKDVPGRNDVKVVSFTTTEAQGEGEYYFDADSFIQVGILAANPQGGGFAYVSGFSFGTIQATEDIVFTDSATTIDVLANDYDADGDALSITIVGDPENGTAVIDNGQILYTPTTTGATDSFTYSVTDGDFFAAQATVLINPSGSRFTLEPSDVATVDITVTPVADAIDSTATDVMGVQGQNIPLALVAGTSPDVDGSETQIFQLNNVPAGASFNDGLGNSVGTLDSGNWFFSRAELTTLNIQLPSEFVGDLSLELVSTNTDSADLNQNNNTDDPGETDTFVDTDPFTVTVDPDTDGDGIGNTVDIDDDNDGILDILEAPALNPQDSGIDGVLDSAQVTFGITSEAPDAQGGTHILDSITITGTPGGALDGTYSDFIVPDNYISGFVGATGGNVREALGSAFPQNLDDPNYDAEVLDAFQSRNLNHFQQLDGHNFTDDSYTLTYSTPVISTQGGFVAVTERGGNNDTIIEAFDSNGVSLGNFTVNRNSDYIDTGHQANNASQNVEIALFPIDDLAPAGSEIASLRVTFGPGATGDGPDGKIFIFGDESLLQIPDSDGDGRPDHLDIDADNDGIPDNIEAQATESYIAPTGDDTDNDGLDDAYDTDDSNLTDGVDISPVNTDGDNAFDYLDTDSDGDGFTDQAESGLTAATTTDDTDGDGLLDDYESGSPNDGFDVNDQLIDEGNGEFALPDSDSDVLADGTNATALTNDFDYRDNTAEVSITANDPGASEPSNNGQFTVTLTQPFSTNTAVNYTISGTATNGTDLTTLSGSVIIPAGATSATIDATVIEDSVVEIDETVTLTLTGGTNANGTVTVGTEDTATVTIADNSDTAAVTIENVTAAEDGTLTFTATLDNAVDGGFAVDAVFASGTATAGNTDFDGATQTLNFTGNAGETVEFTVPLTNDALVEAAEDFTVSLDNLVPATVPTGSIDITDTATGNITDNDAAAVTIENVTSAEDGTLTFTATLDSAVDGGFTVDAVFAAGTATAGNTDFDGATQTLTFTGNAGETVNFTVPLTDDALVEAAEDFTVSLNNLVPATVPAGSIDITDTATGNITDDDTAAVTIENVTSAEDGTLTFTATLDNAVDGGFTVDAVFAAGTATDGGTDFDGTTQTLTFAGNAGETFEFTVPLNDDALVEIAEDFTVSLSNLVAATFPSGSINISDTATGSITDDDSATVTIADAPEVAEGGELVFTVTLSAPVDVPTDITYSTVDGTATTADSDYTSQTSEVLTIPAGQTTGSIRISTTPDTDVELDETLSVNLSSVDAEGRDVSLGATTTGNGTITNNDSATVSIDDAPAVDEGGNLTFTVNLSEAVDVDTVITYSTNDGTATTTDNDYTAQTAETLIIEAGQTSGTIVVATTTDDTVEPDETLSVTLTNIEAEGRDVSLGDATGNGTITNEDRAIASIEPNTDGIETGTNGQFRVNLSNPSDVNTVISYSVAGDATEDSDYSALSGTVTILAGQTTATIDVPVLNDDLLEDSETVTVTLGAITAGNADGITVNTNPATINITDLDEAVVSVEATTDGIETGTNGLFTVRLTQPSDTPTIVSYQVGGDAIADSDYDALSGTVTIPANATSATIDVTILDDNLLEDNETVTVTLQSVTDGDDDITVDTTPATVNITDLDTALVSVTANDPRAAEDADDGQFTVTLTVPSDSPTTLAYTIGGDATPGSDYEPLTGTVTIPANQTSVMIDVPVLDDSLSEPDETVSITLTEVSEGDASIAINPDQNTATVTILADTDGDNIPDIDDLDDDNDGILDTVELATAPTTGPNVGDTDGDGIIDSLDLDSDNDGINDVVEARHGGVDSDGDGQVDGSVGSDGVPDAVQADPNGGTVNYGDPANNDSDNQPDFQDLDSDNDSLSDLIEGGSNGIDSNGDGVVDGPDTDGDGLQDSVDGTPDGYGDSNSPIIPDLDNLTDPDSPDYIDLDSDGNGVDDIDQAGSTILDPNDDGEIDDLTDLDNDGILDVLDDSDQDGIPDADPLETDPQRFGGLGEADTDGDGILNAEDLDDDNDGILDSVEQRGDVNRDTDGDGILDRLDLDSDNDGINDVIEALHGQPDADGDGQVDGTPADFGPNGYLNALETEPESGNPTYTPANSDTDANPDFQDLDSDNDSLSDLYEGGSNGADADGNGVVDGPDSDGDGLQDSVDGNPGDFGDAASPALPNGDNDALPDYRDVDSDGDGINDIDEGSNGVLDGDRDGTIDNPTDADADGILDVADDSDLDTIPDADPAETDPQAYGGLPLNDTDGDGIIDIEDLDDDNDGILDEVEERGNPLRDTDGDGVLDRLDLDADNDGINDLIEANHGAPDTDGDGQVDGTPADFGPNGYLNALEDAPESGNPTYNPANNDTDINPDFQDLDSDNDSLSDLIEGGSGGADADNNGVVDGPDSDGDGLQDSVDGNPNAFGDDGSPATPDEDTDLRPDYIEVDRNNDGLPDIIEAGNGVLDQNRDGVIDDPTDADEDGLLDSLDDSDADGTPDIADPDAPSFGGVPGPGPDADGDGIINDLDLDDDNDGILDTVEEATAPTTGPNIGDTDGDGIPDRLDLDSDNDGINDVIEAGHGEPDANGDGMIDGPVGINGFLNALEDVDTAAATPTFTPVNSDSDNQPDFQDLDSDNDGLSDFLEGGALDGGGVDVDDNGVIDGPDTDGDGIQDSVDGTPNGYGDSGSPELPNEDNDADPDYLDIDSDGDGTNDADPALDSDGDGEIDDVTDNDNDGIADVIDDSDGDTLLDTDPAETDPQRFGGLPATDTDGDGIPDSQDLDDDNDGILDTAEGDGDLDTDGDEIPDSLDPDSDNDGILDVEEAGHGGADTDGDGQIDGPTGPNGLPDAVETGSESGVPSTPPIDTDGDGVEDFQDLDSDNDGLNDVTEDGGLDPDGDGIVGTGTPVDIDEDGIVDAIDPSEGGTTTPDIDTDGDGVEDYRDLDSDNDGINDVTEAGNIDSDGNGTVDGPDTDGDGIADSVDPATGFGDSGPSAGPDTDGDGVADYQDLDSDNDGINDVIEGGNGASDTDGNGTVDGPDTDGDGIQDPTDPANGFGDVGTGNAPDSDGDGVEDFVDLDSDNDGINDVVEGGNPLLDTNGDGLVDGPDSDGDGIIDSVDPANGFGDTGSGESPDTDNDGIDDFLDLDADNDGIDDVIEGGNGDLDADGDGVVDGADRDGDGIIDAVDPADGFGNSGSGDLTDSNGDNIPDFLQPGSNSSIDSQGTGGSDTLTGGNGDDILNGLSDADALNGGSGDDIVNAGSDPDTATGGDDNDIVNAGSDGDNVDAGSGDDITNGGSGDDTINASAGDDIANGGSGLDTLLGGDGNDILNGGSGDDQVFGGNGTDILRGSSGNDLLVGGNDADLLFGGQGNDTFGYTNVSEFGDTIMDFEIIRDQIDLSAIFNGNATLGANVQAQQLGNHTTLMADAGAGMQQIALLLNVTASTLDNSNFLF